MSEEDIEILNDFVNNEDTKYCYDWQGFDYMTILPLIDKLLKENVELQKEIESKNKQIKLMQEMNLPEEIEINYISKDKIRNKIKELEEEQKKEIEETNMSLLSVPIRILKKLLGE